ncbi:MAG: hypothetical protein ABI663_03625 [Chryseolinea sp.]
MTMQYLGSHITNFLQLMSERGYDGHFLCNTSYPGKLKESLTQHLLEVLQGRTSVPPFFLSTYSHWRDEQSPYVRCDFKVRHSHSEGFCVEKMDIINGSSTGTIKSITLPLKANIEIPYYEQANRMVLGGEKKRKIR